MIKHNKHCVNPALRFYMLCCFVICFSYNSVSATNGLISTENEHVDNIKSETIRMKNRLVTSPSNADEVFTSYETDSPWTNFAVIFTRIGLGAIIIAFVVNGRMAIYVFCVGVLVGMAGILASFASPGFSVIMKANTVCEYELWECEYDVRKDFKIMEYCGQFARVDNGSERKTPYENFRKIEDKLLTFHNEVRIGGKEISKRNDLVDYVYNRYEEFKSTHKSAKIQMPGYEKHDFQVGYQSATNGIASAENERKVESPSSVLKSNAVLSKIPKHLLFPLSEEKEPTLFNPSGKLEAIKVIGNLKIDVEKYHVDEPDIGMACGFDSAISFIFPDYLNGSYAITCPVNTPSSGIFNNMTYSAVDLTNNVLYFGFVGDYSMYFSNKDEVVDYQIESIERRMRLYFNTNTTPNYVSMPSNTVFVAFFLENIKSKKAKYTVLDCFQMIDRYGIITKQSPSEEQLPPLDWKTTRKFVKLPINTVSQYPSQYEYP